MNPSLQSLPSFSSFPGFSNSGGLRDSLVWYPALDMGYYPVKDEDAPYDQDYWDKYVRMAMTDMGKRIVEGRLDLVNRRTKGQVVDVGIGCGQFISERNGDRTNTFGYDINPVAVQWLEDRNLLINPYTTKVESVCFWDVLEHIHNPTALLNNVEQFVFVSIPVFRSGPQVLTSKHFRKTEHCWYWTKDSFEVFMSWFGFALLERTDFETRLGREDILSFAFQRVRPPTVPEHSYSLQRVPS